MLKVTKSGRGASFLYDLYTRSLTIKRLMLDYNSLNLTVARILRGRSCEVLV